MAKELDSRLVEYCYLKTIQVAPNMVEADEAGVLTYHHQAIFVYDLKDSSNVQLATARENVRFSEGLTSQDTVTAFMTALDAIKSDCVAEHKEKYSGYTGA